jgi:hypothetical protein
MKALYLAFGVIGLTVAARLEALLRPVPWNAAKIAVLLVSLVYMCGLVWGARRTARRLGVAPVDESRRAIYGMALNTFLAIWLALSIPAIASHLGR